MCSLCTEGKFSLTVVVEFSDFGWLYLSKVFRKFPRESSSTLEDQKGKHRVCTCLDLKTGSV